MKRQDAKAPRDLGLVLAFHASWRFIFMDLPETDAGADR